MIPAPDTRCLTLVGFALAVWRDRGTWRGQAERPKDDRRVVGEDRVFLKQCLRERE